MADTAVHLEQRVLPPVPVRHWIGSLPWGLRALLGYDRRRCAEVVAAFVGEVSRSLKHRAKRLLGLRSVSEAHTGAVASIQRTDSALRLNVHLEQPGLAACCAAAARSVSVDSERTGQPPLRLIVSQDVPPGSRAAPATLSASTGTAPTAVRRVFAG